jgi:hypothetical protein
MGPVTMREECKNFESRTYPNGDTVKKCNLDLAPDAPWRCPDNCPAYERRRIDAAWEVGPLPRTKPTDDVPGLDDGSAAAVLDQAEDIINSIGPDVLADFQPKSKKRWFSRRKRR